MTLDFPVSAVCMCAAQAGTVALPRTAPRLGRRVRRAMWGMVPLVSMVVAVLALHEDTHAAAVLTYLSLAIVPPLAALALARAIRGGSSQLAPLVIPLFLVAWLGRDALAGQIAAVLLSILACVALAVLLTHVTPLRWLKIGILLAALADVVMIGAQYLQPAQDLLDTVTPGLALPAFQRLLFSGIVMGFGDFFIAALLGAVLAAEGGRQDRAALLTFGLALVFDLLFIAIPVLPATVPVAIALLVVELRRGRVASPAPEPAAEIV